MVSQQNNENAPVAKKQKLNVLYKVPCIDEHEKVLHCVLHKYQTNLKKVFY